MCTSVLERKNLIYSFTINKTFEDTPWVGGREMKVIKSIGGHITWGNAGNNNK